ncbi:hypothetical protein CS542_03145 [Pedobacter sp. IW39]|nr:hypothetical protein CS542_03145 [Pedobacter sp. IW39]
MVGASIYFQRTPNFFLVLSGRRYCRVKYTVGLTWKAGEVMRKIAKFENEEVIEDGGELNGEGKIRLNNYVIQPFMKHFIAELLLCWFI